MPWIPPRRAARWLAMFIFLLLSCTPASDSSAQSETPETDRRWDDIARYLAGLPVSPGSPLEQLQKSAEAQRQAQYFRSAYEPIEASRLNPMRSWAATELADARSADRTVFYPFGGPDFLHVYAFFPGAPLYVHFGLEPPGLPPDLLNMAPAARSRVMHLTRESLSSVLRFSFFRTNDMKVELLQSQIGAAPVLLAFAARSGLFIEDAGNIYIDAGGELREGQAAAGSQGTIPGVEIKLRSAEGRRSRLQYFSLNIADDAPNQAFFQYMNAQAPFTSYAKAASYLMHNDSFSRIRQLTLDQSVVYMQDDSGIPLRFFPDTAWDVQLYGAYDRPIPLFAVRLQNDLRKAYQQRERIKNLPFGIGYVFQQGRSNLMIARKKR